jgi:coenzyme F420-0:L-glutamate ligase/coenzyme F420-1:gamma-L-glutamate ligase
MTLTVIPVTGIPDIAPGDDLPGLLVDAVTSIGLLKGDVVAVTHKVVSKAEGLLVDAPDDQAYRMLVEREAAAVLRRRGDLVIAETKHGLVCANAGVDRSNVQNGKAVLLPQNPDRSANRIRTRLMNAFGVEVAVLITDTFGRAWRKGLTDVAIGVAGMNPILDLRGTPDRYGRTMEVTEIAIADEIAAAADLVMGKTAGIPAAIVRGALYQTGNHSANDLIRPPNEDLFR